MDNVKKVKLTKWIGLTSLTSLIFFGAVVGPILYDQFKNVRLTNDFSNTKIGNKNRILNFINDSQKINQSLLSGQLKIVPGKQNTSADRSFITVQEAIDQEWFSFELHSAFNFNLYQDNLFAEQAYIKPNVTNSTYPVVGLRIFAGEGETYSEAIYEYPESSLNGFKQTSEELRINEIVDQISNEPTTYFQLKEDGPGQFGDNGLYGKNIKIDDFDFIKNQKLKELKEQNYFVELTNVEVDKVIPSNLELTFNVIYDNGITQFRKNFNKAIIKGLDVEFGVDDPVSRVKNFIETNKTTYIADLHQYFEYEPPKDENGKAQKQTMQEAYQQGLIKFNSKNENLFTVTNAGLFLEFKPYEPTTNAKQGQAPAPATTEQNVFPNRFDSTTPMYRLFLTSYKDTPLEYTESFIVEGIKQEGAFASSSIQTDVEKLDAMLDQLNANVEDFLTLKTITLENDLESGNADPVNPFADATKPLKIPFKILQTAFSKYKEDSIKFKIPFNFTIEMNQTAIGGITQSPNFDKTEFQQLLNKAVESINKLTIEDKLEAIETNEVPGTNGTAAKTANQFKVNVSLGDKEKDLFISTANYALIEIPATFFTADEDYYKAQVDEVATHIKNTSNVNDIRVQLVQENNENISKAQAIDLMRKAQWTKVFSGISVLNLPTTKIMFSDYDEAVSITINFNALGAWDSIKIEDAIKKEKIMLPILVSKANQVQQIDTVEIPFTNIFGQ